MPTIMSWPSHTFRAMGSQITLWLEAGEGVTPGAFAQAEALFAEVELALSRFRPESELSRLNARPGEWQAVSLLLWQVLSRALALARETGGFFDPTLLNALEAAGYDASFEQVAARANSPAGAGHWQGRLRGVKLNVAGLSVRLSPGVRLDLGGIAKGHTAALAAALLDEFGPCLVDAGGDLVAGRPPRGLPGWPVAVAAPDGAAGRADLFHLWLQKASLATSGRDYRHWRAGDRPAHHIINPRTGRPAGSDVQSATVLAADAARAEGWATAAVVAGIDKGLAKLARAGLAAALVDRRQRLYLTPAMKRHVVWPAEAPTRLADHPAPEIGTL
jgi:thiamine biosynthesis lipoprotein